MLKISSQKLLSHIRNNKDLKKMKLDQILDLSQEIRAVLIETISKKGGHLASNLGVVDLTVALHYVYNTPEDKIIFDVGHQCYTHKLLTGRQKEFSTLRSHDGLSGYQKRAESKHDPFGAGHVGTAVSAALGFAVARDLLHQKYEVISVIGDGSLTNGLTYEGINNIGSTDTNITVVLNDNKWSISKNVGGIAKYLEKLSSMRSETDLADAESIFKSLGFTYFGPIDGHDIKKMIDVFEIAKKTSGPKLIHVMTKKGNGYAYSEQSPDLFHMVNSFALESGKITKNVQDITYTKVFGETLVKIGKKDPSVIAITAAMPAGTGVQAFAQEFPERFFDVGIAEGHAVTFAAGLAANGFKPIVAIYSTFLQRAYDEILHDVALQNLPVIFAIDRAGIVGSDGPTHHGLFDLSYLRNIPNLTIWSPKDENELQQMIYSATLHKAGPIAIRYPRGLGLGVSIDKELNEVDFNKSEKLSSGDDLSIVAVGSMVYPALEAAKKLKESGVSALVYNARSIKPIDLEMIKVAAKTGKILTVEENILDGGFGSAVLEALEELNITNTKIKRIGISGFVEHGDVSILRDKYGLNVNNIFNEALNLLKD